mmetsp:Transcript_26102/g.81083  ORF Transcript_26102/g.81083 Transcript_26102/m.81083 type:complete len:692 (-) Transcript_26102:25-2100(-)
MLRADTGELVRLGVALVVSVTAFRYVWSLFGKRNSQEGGEEKAKTTTPAQNGEASKPQSDNAAADDGIWIYFGSQSGTAEGFAKELEQEASGYDLRATVVDMEDFTPEEFVKHKVVILVVATYGEGDPTDNATEFFKWIADDDLGTDTLQGMQYTVMGLGNRQYVNFNSCGKISDAKMEHLGATRIYVRGEGDDDQNIEEDFEQWKGNGLWPALQAACGLGETKGTGDSGSLETAEAVVKRLPLRAEIFTKAPPIDPLVQVGGADVLGKWYFNSFQVPVTVCTELRQASDEQTGKTTKHIEFNVKSSPGLDWRTADNLEVLPRNPSEVVEWFAERLGVQDQLDDRVTFVRAKGVDKTVKKIFPSPCPVRTALEAYCDLCAAPSRNAAKHIAALATDAEDRAALERLLQDREAYQWLTGEAVRLELREFFELFLPSAELDLSAFLQLCPRQKSRPYTISSSSREDPHTVGICVSMVQEQLPSLAEVLQGLAARGHPAPRAAATLERLGEAAARQPRRFRGLCSTMLCTGTAVGQKLWVAARASSFRLPRRSSTPIVMVGAGTGVAPFRAFVREFRAESAVRASTLLFFGCTKQDTDFLYREELQEALTRDPPALRELVTAFSREQQEKVYVQHRLRERSSEMAKLIGQGAYVYVCGGTSMGKAIRDELVSALGDSDYVSRLQTEGRYIEELW